MASNILAWKIPWTEEHSLLQSMGSQSLTRLSTHTHAMCLKRRFKCQLTAQRLKRLPPIRETRVRSLGREDPLEKEMVTQSSILAWRIPWTEKPGRLQSTGSQRVGHDWATSPSPSTLAPLQAPSKIGPDSRTKVAGYRKYPKTVIIFQEDLQPDSLSQNGSMQEPSTRDRPGAQ